MFNKDMEGFHRCGAMNIMEVEVLGEGSGRVKK